jgi:hypothetical protein
VDAIMALCRVVSQLTCAPDNARLTGSTYGPSPHLHVFTSNPVPGLVGPVRDAGPCAQITHLHKASHPSKHAMGLIGIK